MKSLGQVRELVRRQLGSMIPYDAMSLNQAIEWAINDMVELAVSLKADRLVRRDSITLNAQQNSYQLPASCWSVRGVALKNGTQEIPLNPIFVSQREQTRNEYFSTPGTGNGYYGYWVEHRTVYISPTPVTSVADGLIIRGFFVPPMPKSDDSPLLVPAEAERFIVASAAAQVVPPPPPELVSAIESALGKAQMSLTRWLRSAVQDVPYAPQLEGGNAP